jgi:branched-chain amino acid transport system permease protein
MAGALYAPFLSTVTPTSFGFTESIVILAMLMLGGVGTIRGAILGAVILGALPELFRFVSDYRLLIFGAILVLVLRFSPQGSGGDGSAVARLWQGLGRWRVRPAVRSGGGSRPGDGAAADPESDAATPAGREA